VFRPSAGPVDLRDVRNWWAWVPGATWRTPEGPGSSVAEREDHPVTQVAYRDAEAYAAWAGADLPTEAEWERAARGGLEGAAFAWGDEFAPGGRVMANTWQGRFPWENLLEDGFAGTSPVGSFPANGYGLHDVTGNVWEWTSDHYALPARPARPCCAPSNPRVTAAEAVAVPGETHPRRVIKGGSHLCAPNYCLRYRPAARQSETVETSTTHIGFRCVVRPG
jgi:formylglycine-generating enzyme required for sulfatase activity